MSNKEHSREPQHGLIHPRNRCFNTGYLKRFGSCFAAAVPSTTETHTIKLRKGQQKEFAFLSFATKILFLSFSDDDCFLVSATVSTVGSCFNDS